MQEFDLLLLLVHEAEQVFNGRQPPCLLPGCVSPVLSRDRNSGGAVAESSPSRNGVNSSNVSSSRHLKPRGLREVSRDQESADIEGGTSPAGGGRLRWNPELTRTNTGGSACRGPMLPLDNWLLLMPGPGAATCTAAHSYAHTVDCVTLCDGRVFHLAMLLLTSDPLPWRPRRVITAPHLFRARC